MRRISPAFALATILLASSPALAMHHRMTIGEVLLSSGGDDGIQYIELIDPGEPFPDDPYVLAIYDADGELLDSISFSVAASTTRMFFATAAADTEFGTTRDGTLPVALPADGQACFEHNNGTKFGCAAWGCVNTVLTGTTNNGRGASPADGMSLQAQLGPTPGIVTSYQIAEPTPDAANVAGETAPACATDPDAGPGGIDAGTGDADASPNSPDGGGNGGDGSGNDDDDSGCGCRQSSPSGAENGLLLLGALLLIRRRRPTGTSRRT
jgi:hypothetical protein